MLSSKTEKTAVGIRRCIADQWWTDPTRGTGSNDILRVEIWQPAGSHKMVIIPISLSLSLSLVSILLYACCVYVISRSTITTLHATPCLISKTFILNFHGLKPIQHMQIYKYVPEYCISLCILVLTYLYTIHIRIEYRVVPRVIGAISASEDSKALCISICI